MNSVNRRQFLEFMGATGVAFTGFGLSDTLFARGSNALPFHPLPATNADELRLAEGFAYELLIKFGDKINAKGDVYGYDNDYTAFLPVSDTEALLWVNHESPNPVFVSGFEDGMPRTRAQVDKEMAAVGGSILKLARPDKSKPWRIAFGSSNNRRLNATTAIPFAGGQTVAGSKVAIGTFGNCAGGVTPWKTVLTCEENFADFYGDIDFFKWKAGDKASRSPSWLGWEAFYDRSPLHYGWVVEVEPATGKAKKLVSLGRFAHEGATVVEAKDGRIVVYMGDDANDQCVYKFISSKPDSLEDGTLYVADLPKGRWLPLDITQQERLKSLFRDQTEVLTFAREAAKAVGGTPLDRPEAIAINPRNHDVIVALTNNIPKGNYFGSLLKIAERGGDHLSLEFQSSTLISGGPETGFACPDNIIFDKHGNLWMTSDMSEKAMHKDPYRPFGNNSLFFIPLAGPSAGKPLRVASAPIDAELTGPSFSADGQTLFLSVQHPGAATKKAAAPTSRWPSKGDIPRPGLIAITGALFKPRV